MADAVNWDEIDALMMSNGAGAWFMSDADADAALQQLFAQMRTSSERTQETTSGALAALREAQTRYGGLLGDQAGALEAFRDAPDRVNLPLLAFAAGLGRPTRTGAFGESMSQGMNEAIPAIQAGRNEELEIMNKIALLRGAQSKLSYDLAAQELETGIDLGGQEQDSYSDLIRIITNARGKGTGAPSGFRPTADGLGLEPIPGGPNDPAYIAGTRAPTQGPAPTDFDKKIAMLAEMYGEGSPEYIAAVSEMIGATGDGSGSGGPSLGDSIQANAWNIVGQVRDNPDLMNDPEWANAYNGAYQILMEPSTRFDPATGQQITIAGKDLTGYPVPTFGAAVPDPAATDAALPGTTPAGTPAPVDPGATMPPNPGAITVETITDPKLSMDESVKLSNLTAAMGDLDKVMGSLLSPDGGLTENARALIAQGADYGVADGLPWTEGRGLRQQTKRAIEVLLRLRTGAAAPDQEVENYMNMYFPKIGDTDAQVEEKLRTLEGLFSEMGNFFEQGRPGLDIGGDGSGTVIEWVEDADGNLIPKAP